MAPYTRPVLCRLCGFPAPDGGVPVSEVDRDKLSEWSLQMMDTELDQEGLDKAMFCQFCVLEARFIDENCDLENLPKWWKTPDNGRAESFIYNYILDDLIQPCAVTIPVMSNKQILQKHANNLEDTGLLHPAQTRGLQEVISKCSIICSAHLESKQALVKHVGDENKNFNFKCSECSVFFLSGHEKKNHLQKFHPYSLKFKCFCCDSRFSAKCYLAQHLKSVHNRKLICCKYHQCGAYFQNEQMRQVHFEEVHKTEDKVKCIYCDKLFHIKTLTIHTKNHHNSICIKCDFFKKCFTFFHTKEEKEKHILEVHKTKSKKMQCIYCQKNVLRVNIRSHVKKNHVREMIKCHYNCTTYFHTLEEKQKHVLEVHESGEDKYRCIYCKKMISNSTSSSLILQHMRQHHKKEAIKCDYQLHCPNFFLTQEEKQKHILEVHESGGDKIRCQFCSRMVRALSMKGHIRNLHKLGTKGVESEMVECIYCKRTITKKSLSTHVSKKHKTEAIRCTYNKYCGTLFLTFEDRDNHVEKEHMSGKQEKNFKCCFCDKVNTRSVLHKHIQRQHPEAIKCKSHGCWEYFCSKNKQEEHFEKVHTPEEKGKTFRCSYCPFVAPSTEERKVHVAQVHPKNVTFKCPQCPKVYISEMALARHVQCVHSARRECPNCQQMVLGVTWARHLQRSSCQTCKVAFACRGFLSMHPRICGKTSKKTN